MTAKDVKEITKDARGPFILRFGAIGENRETVTLQKQVLKSNAFKCLYSNAGV